MPINYHYHGYAMDTPVVGCGRSGRHGRAMGCSGDGENLPKRAQAWVNACASHQTVRCNSAQKHKQQSPWALSRRFEQQDTNPLTFFVVVGADAEFKEGFAVGRHLRLGMNAAC